MILPFYLLNNMTGKSFNSQLPASKIIYVSGSVTPNLVEVFMPCGFNERISRYSSNCFCSF
jgi:hypothetical protein